MKLAKETKTGDNSKKEITAENCEESIAFVDFSGDNSLAEENYKVFSSAEE